MNESQLTDEQAGVVGLFSLCCCFVGFAVMIGLVVWLVRRGSSPSASAPSSPVEAHLSVLALALDASLREHLAAMLQTPQGAVTVGSRVELVQRFVNALLPHAQRWHSFGYGEKTLGDLAQAKESYALAVQQFSDRASAPGDSEAGLFVVTMVMTTRGPLGGVSRLDARDQVQQLLLARQAVAEHLILGAELVFSPTHGAMTESALMARYPEMSRLVD